MSEALVDPAAPRPLQHSRPWYRLHPLDRMPRHERLRQTEDTRRAVAAASRVLDRREGSHSARPVRLPQMRCSHLHQSAPSLPRYPRREHGRSGCQAPKDNAACREGQVAAGEVSGDHARRGSRPGVRHPRSGHSPSGRGGAPDDARRFRRDRSASTSDINTSAETTKPA